MPIPSSVSGGPAVSRWVLQQHTVDLVGLCRCTPSGRAPGRRSRVDPCSGAMITAAGSRTAPTPTTQQEGRERELVLRVMTMLSRMAQLQGPPTEAVSGLLHPVLLGCDTCQDRDSKASPHGRAMIFADSLWRSPTTTSQ